MLRSCACCVMRSSTAAFRWSILLPPIELIKDDKGQVAGACSPEHGDRRVPDQPGQRLLIIATGGAGRLHYQGFPTSNHYGATADGLVLGYRAGAPLLYQDTIQYHPTGAAYPAQLFGALVTEKVRSAGRHAGKP
ncbi:MAG: FAD-binding protein [Clostridium sp.]